MLIPMQVSVGGNSGIIEEGNTQRHSWLNAPLPTCSEIPLPASHGPSGGAPAGSDGNGSRANTAELFRKGPWKQREDEPQLGRDSSWKITPWSRPTQCPGFKTQPTLNKKQALPILIRVENAFISEAFWGRRRLCLIVRSTHRLASLGVYKKLSLGWNQATSHVTRASFSLGGSQELGVMTDQRQM